MQPLLEGEMLRAFGHLLRILIWPTLGPLALMYGVLRFAAPESLPATYRWWPPVLLAVAFLLGVRFNRSRASFAALLMLVCELLELRGVPKNFLYCALGLGFVAFTMMRERGFLTVAGAMRWSYVALVGVVGVLYKDLPGLMAAFGRRFLPFTAPKGFGDVAFCVICVSGAVLLWRLLAVRQVMESALCGAFATCLIAFRAGDKHIEFYAYLALGAVILLLAILEISYSLAYRDELTGLPARRALYEEFARLGGRYSLAMTDIDHFKKFNDKYGHDAGDEVLRLVAQKLARVSGGGKAFRYGGEEFTIVFPGKAVEETVDHLEALREAIAHSPFTPKPKPPAPGKNGAKKKRAPAAQKPVTVTISLGAAEHERGQSPEDVLKKADENLYKSKENGRNQLTY